MRSKALLICTLLLSPASIVHAAEEDEARTVIDKAIEAAGGREALAKYEKPFVMEMKIKVFTPRGITESKGKKTRWFPDCFRDEGDGSTRKFSMLFNGKSGKYTGYTAQNRSQVSRLGGQDGV